MFRVVVMCSYLLSRQILLVLGLHCVKVILEGKGTDDDVAVLRRHQGGDVI